MAHPKPPTVRHLRSFTTTLRTSKPAPHSPVPRYTKGPPPYPYGPATHYKQSDSGLYGGATLQFGNQVSSKNAHKSRRMWRPNMHNKRLWSDGLGRFVQVKVQARVLRTIDKCGGLDGYLLGEKAGRVKELGVEGWRLRWLVMRTGKVRRRVRGEREALGLPAERKAKRADTLDEEVERASGEVVGRIEGADAGISEAEDEEGNFVDGPSADPTALEDHIERTIRVIEAETVAEALRRAQKPKPSLTANALPSRTDEPEEGEDNPTNPPSRRSTKGEKRAWRAERALDSDDEVESAEGALALRAEVARIEEVVEVEMEGLEGEGRERLEEAMERLRSASQELERVEAGAAEKEKEEEEEKEAEGGILGKIKGLFARR